MILGNTLSSYLYALAAFAIAICISLCLRYVIISRLKLLVERTNNNVDDVIFSVLTSVKMPFYVVVSLYIAMDFLVIHPTLRKVIDAVLIICIIYQIIKVLNIFLDYSLAKKVDEGNGAGLAHIKDMVQVVIQAGLWAVGLLFILSNLGVNITSLVAGLGIGGIAVALAVQSILSDLFSYFAIYFDKPFVKGDLITIGTQVGVVEKVGVKTTRIRALQGEEIVISNSELTSSRIQNFKKMEERRVLFSFGITYETPLEKLEKIPQYVQDIITTTERTRFDRAHLLAFGDSAYRFEVVYYVQSAVYNEYMDVHQAIHFQIISIFAQEGIEFAYPTQKVHLLECPASVHDGSVRQSTGRGQAPSLHM